MVAYLCGPLSDGYIDDYRDAFMIYAGLLLGTIVYLLGGFIDDF